MRVKELAGRVVYYTLRPLIHVFIRGSRRAYVVMEHEGKILVVKNILGSGKWHLPGGGCHSNESFQEGAVRELREETGVKASVSQLEQLSVQAFRARRKFDYQLFLLRVPNAVELKIDTIEILEARWVRPGELNASNA